MRSLSRLIITPVLAFVSSSVFSDPKLTFQVLKESFENATYRVVLDYQQCEITTSFEPNGEDPIPNPKAGTLQKIVFTTNKAVINKDAMYLYYSSDSIPLQPGQEITQASFLHEIRGTLILAEDSVTYTVHIKADNGLFNMAQLNCGWPAVAIGPGSM